MHREKPSWTEIQAVKGNRCDETYQWSVSVPSGVPFDRPNDGSNFSLDDVDLLVHHSPLTEQTHKIEGRKQGFENIHFL